MIPQLQAVIRSRSGALVPGLAALTVQPSWCSWMAVGGPDAAGLTASGPVEGLWELADLLNGPVELVDLRRAEPVWWGYIDAVELHCGALVTTLSLDRLANRVCTVYSHLVPGSSPASYRATTAWAEDAESVGVFGHKEHRVSLAGANLAQAEQARDTCLAERRWPAASVQVDSAGMSAAAPQAVIHCRGYWHWLDWQYYANPAGRVEHLTGGSQDWLGAQAADMAYAQRFSLPGGAAGWLADQALLRVKTIGSPSDGLVVEICADAGSAPGGVLAAGTVAAAGLGPSSPLRQVAVDLRPRAALQPGQTYWLVVRRASGQADGMHYYEIDLDPGGGDLLVANQGVWTAHHPGATLWFRVSGVVETGAQLGQMLASQGRLSGLSLPATGVFSSPYWNGEGRLRAEIEALLRSGTSASRRLLAEVDRQRRVQVAAAPAAGAGDWSLDPQGTLRDPFGLVATTRGPAGVWLQLRGVVPGTADVARVQGLGRVWLEGSRLDCRTGAWQLW